MNNKKIIFLFLLGLLIMVLVLTGFYLIAQQDQKIKDLTDQIISLEGVIDQTTEVETDSESLLNKDQVIERLNTAINLNDRDQLDRFMADEVFVTVEASGGVGLISKSLAMESILNRQSGLINFFQNQEMVEKIKNNIEDLSDYIIGISDDGSIIAYKLNSNNKISDLYFGLSVLFDL